MDPFVSYTFYFWTNIDRYTVLSFNSKIQVCVCIGNIVILMLCHGVACNKLVKMECWVDLEGTCSKP